MDWYIVQYLYPNAFQKFIDIMPILFGLIVTPDGGKLFNNLFEIASKLPDRFTDGMEIKWPWLMNGIKIKKIIS